jgi:predicted permease
MTQPLRSRLRAWLASRRLDARLREEFADHLERATQDNVDRGMTRPEARRAALVAFGGLTQTTEACRDVSRLAPLWGVWQDLRYATRIYRKTPVVTLATILTATLAIGASTTVFTLLNALVLRDLPVRDPGSLVRVAPLTRDGLEGGVSYRMFQQLASSSTPFESIMGMWGMSMEGVELRGEFTTAGLWAVTGNVYEDLGIRPAAGRLLMPADGGLIPLTAQPVAVLGHSFWRRRLHGDAAIVGQTIRIQGVPFTVVGVAPTGFTGFGISAEPDITVPLPTVALINGRSVDTIASRWSQWIDVVARLRPGVTLDQARARLTVAWPHVLAASLPPDLSAPRLDEFLSQRLSVAAGGRGAEPYLRPRFTSALVIAFSITVLILAIACTNLSGLMLARTGARSSEIAVRLALGASRRRLWRQLLTEGILLAAVGGLGGLVCAAWASKVLSSVIFEDYVITVGFDASPDRRVAAFVVGTALIFGALLALLPAWRATRQQPLGVQPLNARTTTRSPGRGLVGAQVALSLVLLIAAGLFVRTLQAIRSTSSGMTSAGVVVAFPFPHPGAYSHLDNDVYYRRTVERLKAIPGVDRASVSLDKPASGGTGLVEQVASTAEPVTTTGGVESILTPVAPDFFGVLVIPIRQGRDLSWADTSRSRMVAVVSEALARRLFGDAPLGRHVRIGLSSSRQDLEIVGVVSNVRLYDRKNARLEAIYTAALQDADVNAKCFVLRGAGVSFDQIRRAVESGGVEFLEEIRSLDYLADRALLRERLTAMMATSLGVLGAILAAIGVFALMSYSVAQRRREIGIRMALGAEPRRLVGDVLRDGLRIILAGLGAGLIMALAAARLLETFLFGIAAHDVLTFLVASILLVTVSIAACLIPAVRASRVDPLLALRSE